MTILGSAEAVPLPDLREAELTFDRVELFTGQRFTVSDRAWNAGGARAGKSTTRYYLSVDSEKSRHDRLLGARLVPKLPRGGSNIGTKQLRIPIGTRTRRYYVLACSDARRQVRESREGNNCAASSSK